jgi:hypothetical protein
VSDLKHAADRAPRHSVQRLVGLLFICKRILSAFRLCSRSSPWPPQDTEPT